MTGRQLARVSSVETHETIWSELYPGNRHTLQCFQTAVEETEKALALQMAQRKRTVWRMDGGSGSDEQLCWLLNRGYHVIAKGISQMRAASLAKQVQRWDTWEDAWIAEVKPPIDYGGALWARCEFSSNAVSKKVRIVTVTMSRPSPYPPKGS